MLTYDEQKKMERLIWLSDIRDEYILEMSVTLLQPLKMTTS